jgi:hypothetical protein
MRGWYKEATLARTTPVAFILVSTKNDQPIPPHPIVEEHQIQQFLDEYDPFPSPFLIICATLAM